MTYDQAAWWIGTIVIVCASSAATVAGVMFVAEYVIRYTGHFMRIVHYVATRDAIRKAQRTGDADDFGAARKQFEWLMQEAMTRTGKDVDRG